MSSCPPFLVRLADSARRMRPAHVPHVGLLSTLKTKISIHFGDEITCDLTHFTKFLSGSSMPHLCATNEMAVLSPPGMMSPSHELSSDSVRTSLKVYILFWSVD